MKKAIFAFTVFVLIFQTTFAKSQIEENQTDEFSDNFKEFSILNIFENETETNADKPISQTDEITKEIYEKAFSKLFGTNITAEKDTITNEYVFVSICKILNIEKKEKPFSIIRQFGDFGLISPENKGYYESVFAFKKTSKKHLNPDKIANYKSFLQTLRIFEKEIFEKNGFEHFTDIITENSLFDDTRTIKTAKGRTFKINSKNDFLTLGLHPLRGTRCEFIAKNNILYSVNGIEKSKTSEAVKAAGIYKAKLFLFDQYTGKFILKNLCHYENNTFSLKSQSYSEFESFGNFITVLNTIDCDKAILNQNYIDKNIIFITTLDEGKEKIVYVYLN